MPSIHDILLGDLPGDPVHARPRQHPAREHVDQPAEGDHAADGCRNRAADRETEPVVEHDEEQRAREQRDRRGGTAQSTPLARQHRAVEAGAAWRSPLLGVRHMWN
jgi:hypothetical protein